MLSTDGGILSDGFTFDNPGFGAPMDLKAAQAFLDGMRAAFDVFRGEISELIGEDDKVVARTMLRGTHTGDFQGIKPTGWDLAVQSLAVFKINSGKVDEEYALIDLRGLMRQLSEIDV